MGLYGVVFILCVSRLKLFLYILHQCFNPSPTPTGRSCETGSGRYVDGDAGGDVVYSRRSRRRSCRRCELAGGEGRYLAITGHTWVVDCNYIIPCLFYYFFYFILL